MHSVSPAVLGLFPLVLVACFPPSLSLEHDAGVNSPPGILSVVVDTTQLVEAATLTLTKTAMGTQGMMTLSLIDTDLDEALHARVFVNWTAMNPIAPRATCDAAPNGHAVRDNTLCSMIGMCLTTDIGQTQDMTVVVFDRPVDDTVQPLYQYDGPVGLSASKFFHLQCVAGT